MRTFCIVCPEIKGEQEAAQKHFNDVGIKVDFIQGIHGETSGLVTTLPYEFDNPGSNFNVGPKIISLCLNHVLAWTACSVLPDDMFLILESDAKFPPDWKQRIDQAIADLPPDWDVLYVGSCNCAGKPVVPIKGDLYKMSAENPHHAPQCTQAILYTPKAIRKILSTQRKFYTGIDLALIFHSLQFLNVYVVLPRIVDQHGIIIEP
jgi:GR25 family glycosyltransferase involved in LPS biosynthesis